MLRLFPLLALAACSVGGSPVSDAEGTLVNLTTASILPLAVDAEMATRIDISPEFEVADRGEVIAPGETAPLAIEGYERGDGVVVFVYRVRGDTATFATTLSVDGEAFERAGGVVTVSRL